ncbi:choice-of-anchor D domain-containing protein [Flavobacteriaceae bacterium]|nr:choice-of-anchor D domain-containing protein [Flavobacteriaceae bacterium]
MKKLIILLSFSSFVFAQNSFNVNTQSIGVNSSFFVEISLDNTSEVTAFQFDISHNESAYELSNTSALTSRAENHTLSVSTIDDNTIRVLVYSAANELISIGNGAILNLSFNSKNEPGTYNINLSDIVLSDANGASLGVSSNSGSVTILGPRYNLVTSSVNFGEIPMESSPTQSVSVSNTGNQDLIISGHTLDTPFSINQSYPVTISPGNSSSFTINADTSSKQVVSKELSFTTNDQDALRALQTTTIQADIFAVNEIYIGSGQGESNTQITIPVSISNMEPFIGFQFDVTLPNDVSYVENSAAFTTRASDHNIAANMIDSNTLRFVSYSGSNADFLGNDGEVFSFKVIPNITSGTYTLPISNSIISNVELGDILSEAYNGSFTINAPYLSTSVQTINYGGVPITETRTTNITLTNTGSAELVIDELVFEASALSFPLAIPTTLAVGESTSVELIFDPIQIGSFNQDISIRNNSPEEQQIITVLAEVFSPNYLKIVDKDVLRNQTWAIELNLANNDDIRGIQFDVTLPEGFVLDTDNIVEESIIDNFSMSLSFQGNNTYRFVIYTVSNDYLIPGDETILQLPVFIENTVANGQYPFEFSSVVLSSSSNQNIVSEALSIGYVNVVETLNNDEYSSATLKIYPNPTQDFWHIESNHIINTIEVFDLIGRKVDFLTPLDTETSISAQNLPSGLYFLVVNRDTTLRLIKN